MNTVGTAVEVPHSWATGVCFSGLGTADPELMKRLVGCSLNFYEVPLEHSLTSNQPEVVSLLRGSVFDLPGCIYGALSLGGGSVQVVPVVTYEASGSWPQEPLQLFGCHGSSVFREVCGMFQNAAAGTVFPVQTVNSTVPARDRIAEAKFKTAFQRAREERFEDGMESEFSKELESLIRAYGPGTKEILARLLEDDSLSARVWGEAMRCLGRLDDPGSHEARLWVLEKGLTSGSALVRDGAALGLALMDDPSAIPYLQRAVESETLAGLRADMQEVLLQLTRQ